MVAFHQYSRERNLALSNLVMGNCKIKGVSDNGSSCLIKSLNSFQKRILSKFQLKIALKAAFQWVHDESIKVVRFLFSTSKRKTVKL